MKPLVITMGDPSGIGPEILIRAWEQLREEYPICAVGDADFLAALGTDVVRVTTPQAHGQSLPVIDVPLATAARPGKPDHANAAAIIDMIRQGALLARSGAAAGLVTCPISKQVLIEGGGFAHPGHTEFLAHLDNAPRAVMMLACAELKAIPVTIHIPLAQVPDALTSDLLDETLRITQSAFARDFGLQNPRIAVGGLNPHAGEGGLMGREDLDVITPVIHQLRAEGMDVTGPLPADTMFHAEARKSYDVAVMMYHDQALIPVKTLGFDRGVNVTLGLSYIRTSPDHGTAFDIAGAGHANPQSLIAAIEMAAQMARARHG